ncbi:MAG: hydantoinase B/oxoprolinase family protein, partial [Armatimonadetes bacterium]|nr:hydantoinase B/oxoprolinase family protein [Armatimonadota bacterium]
MENWRLFVDTGGTFTDCLAVAPDGRRLRCKVLSSGALRGRVVEQVSKGRFQVEQSWGAPAGLVDGWLLVSASGEARVQSFDPATSVLSVNLDLPQGSSFEVRSPDSAPILAAKLITATLADLPKIGMRLGTTMGTNALLEGKGADVAFFVTEGFRDLLRIGDQTRPDLFALNVQRPEPLHAEVVCVQGRLAADGTEIEPLNIDRAAVAKCLEQGMKVAAISLLHSYRNPSHEQELKRHLHEAGFDYVVCSAELAPLIKWVPRAETAVVDAYLGPLMSQYLQSVAGAIAEGQLHVMTSAGGLVSSGGYTPKDGLLSGPAGGVVGAAAVGTRAGIQRLITFDMGGTSTDVSRFDGDFDYQDSHTVGQARLMAPALKIETVAAGGGSVCGFDGELLSVGPESAGAEPGPACYGSGGPLTITDVNLLLGRLDIESFGLPVFPEASKERLEQVQQEYENAREEKVDTDELLQSFLAIANDRMANAIRTISVREGYDPTEYALVAFGGAGGQHACAVADNLGMDSILFPADAGLLSAFGMEQARVERIVEKQVLSAAEKFMKSADGTMSAMEQRARSQLAQEGYAEGQTEVRRRTAMVRYTGQEASVSIDFEQPSEIVPKFLERYRQVFGYVPEGRQIEVVSLRLIASTLEEQQSHESFDGGEVLEGPQVVSDAYSTLVIEPGWTAKAGSQGSLMLERTSEASKRPTSPAAERELFTNRFRSIVEEMGAQLQRTAISTNIKERLDYSCAMLDCDGRLIVNAPHMPVHLGALGVSVREVTARLDLGPGDVAITNHPACGGSHLPDITLIAPVFGDGEKLLGYVANRAHHAEIGGVAPGSMSPDANSLLEEGVVIPPTYLFRAGEEQYGTIERMLTEAAYPTRRIDENMADLQAQTAANRRGEQALRQLAEEHGETKVIEQMGLIREQAARAVRTLLT